MILGARTYTVTRYASGTWVDGEYTRGAMSSWTVRGSLQPIDDAEDLKQNPEGARTDAVWILICDGRQTELEDGDFVTVDGAEYLAKQKEDWTHHKPLPYRSYELFEVTAK